MDEAEQLAASTALVDHIVLGRSAEARTPTPAELRATLIVRFPIEEGSAKVRTRGPVDAVEHLDLEIWAGEVPLETVDLAPVSDPNGVVVAAPPSLQVGPLQRMQPPPSPRSLEASHVRA